jgi:hypothetical protein
VCVCVYICVCMCVRIACTTCECVYCVCDIGLYDSNFVFTCTQHPHFHDTYTTPSHICPFEHTHTNVHTHTLTRALTTQVETLEIGVRRFHVEKIVIDPKLGKEVICVCVCVLMGVFHVEKIVIDPKLGKEVICVCVCVC